jgi:putative ABC transport system substrate-binding protein
VAAGVDVLVTSGNAPGRAAAQVTRTITIVLASSADVISAGVIKSLSHPDGNVTGLTFALEDTVGERLELLKGSSRNCAVFACCTILTQS